MWRRDNQLEFESMEFGDLRVGQADMPGRRGGMEDVSLMSSFVSRADHLFVGVFDGHSGKATAEFAGYHLMETIEETEAWKAYVDGDCSNVTLLGEALKQGFIALDEKLRPVVKALIQDCGSTAVVAVISPSHIVCANAGDSRCVLATYGASEEMSRDHKGNVDVERLRIKRAGGFVRGCYADDSGVGVPRNNICVNVFGGYMLPSRAFGDFDFKRRADLPAEEQAVTCVPDIEIRQRVQRANEFLLLACDGVWDVMSSDEAVAKTREWFSSQPSVSPSKVAGMLAELAYDKNSKDNISVLIVKFPSSSGMRRSSRLTEKKRKLANSQDESHLMEACLRGDVKTFQELVSAGVSDRAILNGREPLTAICRDGHIEMVRELLSRGATIFADGSPFQTSNSTIESPLFAAFNNGHMEVVRELAMHGADLYCCDQKRDTVFHLAMGQKSYEKMEQLVKMGVDVNSVFRWVNKGLKHPLYEACETGDVKMVLFLLSQGARVLEPITDNCCIHNLNPLVWACGHGHKNIVKVLSEHGADLNTAEIQKASWTTSYDYPLHAAVRGKHEDTVKLLLDLGADVNCGTSTALEVACSEKNMTMVDYLLSRGADANKGQKPPLTVCCSLGNLELVKQLLHAGADPNIGERDGGKKIADLPLHAAARNGHLEVVKYLLDHGAEIDATCGKYSKHTSALFEAYKNDKWDIAQYLLSRGSDANTGESTPLVLCSSKGNVEAVKLLLQAGADPNLRETTYPPGSLNDLPLVAAVKAGSLEVVRVLLDHGADVNSSCESGEETALVKACEHGDSEMVKCLLSRGATVVTEKIGQGPFLACGHFEKVMLLLAPVIPTTHLEEIRAFLDTEPSDFYPTVLTSAKQVLENELTLRREGL